MVMFVSTILRRVAVKKREMNLYPKLFQKKSEIYFSRLRSINILAQ